MLDRMSDATTLLTPPDAPRVDFVRRFHGDEVHDPYHWMADKADARLIAYLEQENAYTDAMTASLAPLVDEIYRDISTRTRQTDLSVPQFVKHTDGSTFWYFTRTTEGLDYPAHCRIPADGGRDAIPDVTQPAPDEQVLLDVNALAAGHEFCSLGWAEMSPDGRLLAYSVDHEGDERYDLYVRDVTTGTVIDGPIPQIGGGGAWLGANHLLYTRVDDAWRPHEVWRHRLHEPEDALVFAEPDERFWVGVEASRDRRWVLIELASKITTETHLIATDDPTAAPRCLAPRREGVEYIVEMARDRMFVLHNANHPQFELAVAPAAATDADAWQTIVPPRDETRLTGVTFYDACLVVSHRTQGLAGLALLHETADGASWEPLTFDEPIYDVDAEEDPDLGTDRIRFTYESMVTPPSVFEYHLATGRRTLLKQTPVEPHPDRGPYQPADYVQERIWATAADGVRVPMSIVRRRETPVDGTAPCLLYGYGSYEIPSDPVFGIARLSLLDHGFVYAVAHIRGGGDLGRPWYDDGKLLAKKNTFTDFVACGRELVARGYAAPGRLGAEGGSAGGLLMGAIINLAPDLFRAVHAAVPFVDALTTILNPDLPLTVMEWEEWGNPLDDPAVYAYMKSYTPYENVEPVVHPAILVTTSLNDTRVEVTEPAKWVARLRDVSLNGPDRPILLKTEMVAGHGGTSARYRAWRDRAFELAWLIDQLGRR